MEREFLGVWLPREIWLNKDLNATEKVLFAEIESLATNGNGCYASNEYFAKFCGCSERSISSSIAKLKELGLISTTFDGRNRSIRVEKIARQTRKNCEAVSQFLLPNNIYNNTSSNQFNISIYNKEKKLIKKESIVEEMGFGKELKETVLLWLKYKQEKGQTYKPTGLDMFLAKIKRLAEKTSEQHAIDSIVYSMENNYAGVYEPKGKKQEKKQEIDAWWEE